MSSDTISVTPIILWCWVRGSTSIFNITVGRDNRVSKLKEVIKERKPNDFAKVDADRLKLLKLKNPVNDERISDIQNLTLQDNEDENDDVAIMKDMRKIVTYWPENQAPPEDLIHVIVEAPDLAAAKKKAKISRSFASSNRVHLDINYYIKPKMAEKLGKFLLEGKFCLLYGHRQSGKTTTAYAIKGWLEENSNKEIYTISFSSGIVTGEGLSTFWHSVCSKMASLDANKFKFNIDDGTASSSTFEGFFSKYNYPSAKDCIIIIDEASCLGNRDGSSNSQVISSFISSLRNLKDGRGDSYNVYSFLLVGTNVIRDFLVQRERPDSKDPGSNISPFSDEASLTSARFTSREIEQLLEQFSSENNYKLDIRFIAYDIYSITLGHKGLVGLCCFYLADRVMVGRRELKFDDWRRETYNLPGFIRGKATYESIIRALHDLSFTQKKILMEVIRFGYDVVSMDNSDAKFLLGEGMVIIDKTLQDGEGAIIRCAAPILRTVMITQLSEVKIDLSKGPAQDKNKTVDGKWLLERTVEHLSIQHIFTDKTMNKTGRPSEYAWQAEFISVLKNLLPKAYPYYFFRVLPEVRELEDDDNNRQRLDILVSDGVFIESYGYELVVEANKSEFNDHYERSKKYTDLHGCYVYMVNLCTEGKLIDCFGSGHKNVAVVHVVYNLNEGYVNLIYEKSKVTVPILSIPYFKPYE